MTDDEIRIAVAECCGAVWKRQSCSPWNPDDDSRNVYFRRLYFIEPGDIRGPATLQDAFGNEAIADNHDHLPNYPADLNACAEMEKILTEDEWSSYCIELNRIACRIECKNTHTCGYTIAASARQRCEAFLRVKGRWNESENHKAE